MLRAAWLAWIQHTSQQYYMLIWDGWGGGRTLSCSCCGDMALSSWPSTNEQRPMRTSKQLSSEREANEWREMHCTCKCGQLSFFAAGGHQQIYAADADTREARASIQLPMPGASHCLHKHACRASLPEWSALGAHQSLQTRTRTFVNSSCSRTNSSPRPDRRAARLSACRRTYIHAYIRTYRL